MIAILLLAGPGFFVGLSLGLSCVALAALIVRRALRRRVCGQPIGGPRSILKCVHKRNHKGPCRIGPDWQGMETSHG